MAGTDTKRRTRCRLQGKIIFPQGKELLLPVTHGQGNVKVGIHIQDVGKRQRRRYYCNIMFYRYGSGVAKMNIVLSDRVQ